MTTVGDLMSRDLHTVPRETPVSACLKIMQTHDIRHLPVVEPSGRLLGMVSDYEVLGAMRSGDRLGWAIEQLQPSRLTVTPESSVAAALTKMLEARLDWVIAIDPVGSPDGMFTERDAVAHAFFEIDPWPVVSEVMTADELFVVPPSTPAPAALGHMLEHRIRHLLVLEDEVTMHGVVSHRDLVGQTGPVKKYMHDPVFVTREGDSLRNAVEVMVRQDVGSIPVVRGEREAVGIVTRVDVIRLLLERIGG